MAEIISAVFGDGIIVSNTSRRELHILNQTAARMWAVCHGAADDNRATACKTFLQDTYALDEAEADEHSSNFVNRWTEASLFVRNGLEEAFEVEDDVRSPTDRPLTSLQPGQIGFDVGCCPIALDVTDPLLRQAVNTNLRSMMREEVSHYRHIIQITGRPDRWFLSVDGTEVYCGTTPDEAVVSIISQSLYLAFQAVENLLVVHGAGVAAPHGAASLLIAPSGSGKTTLAAALNANGYTLLNDDVVPVDMCGRVRSLSSPFCIKKGSWEALSIYRRDLYQFPEVSRFGHKVRFLPPVGEQPSVPIDCKLILFPKYDDTAPAKCELLMPYQTLQKLIAAGPFLQNVDQLRLTRLAQWIESTPAYSIVYPDLESALQTVRTLMETQVWTDVTTEQ